MGPGYSDGKGRQLWGRCLLCGLSSKFVDYLFIFFVVQDSDEGDVYTSMLQSSVTMGGACDGGRTSRVDQQGHVICCSGP